MKLVDRGLTIDGEKVPYSPNSTGNNKVRAVLDKAMAVVEEATPDKEWLPRDLRATVERELEALKQEGWVRVEFDQGRPFQAWQWLAAGMGTNPMGEGT